MLGLNTYFFNLLEIIIKTKVVRQNHKCSSKNSTHKLAFLLLKGTEDPTNQNQSQLHFRYNYIIKNN